MTGKTRGQSKMLIYLIRHGETDYNTQKRYQGQRDIPLSAKGRAELHRADFTPALVYVSPLIRARQTAEILFPGVEQIPVEGLREMNFGSYEGRTYVHMENDPDYLAWVEANAHAAHPDGERKADFCARSCAAFARVMEDAARRGLDRLVIVAHGGTQMAVMEHYALPHRPFEQWHTGNGGGHKLEDSPWQTQRKLNWLCTVNYGAGETGQ